MLILEKGDMLVLAVIGGVFLLLFLTVTIINIRSALAHRFVLNHKGRILNAAKTTICTVRKLGYATGSDVLRQVNLLELQVRLFEVDVTEPATMQKELKSIEQLCKKLNDEIKMPEEYLPSGTFG